MGAAVAERAAVMKRAAGTNQPVSRAAVAALALSLAWAPLGAAELLDRVLAVVSGTVITLSDARASLAFGFVGAEPAGDRIAAAVRWLIDRQLVLDEVLRSGGEEVDQARVAREMAAIKGRFASEAAFEAELERLGLGGGRAMAFVRETLEARRYVDRRFGASVEPSEEELRDYYARHLERFVRDGRQLDFVEAADDVRTALQNERREQAVATWLDRLRRRSSVVEIYRAPR